MNEMFGRWKDLPENVQHAVLLAAGASGSLRSACKLFRRLLPAARAPPSTAEEACEAVASGLLEIREQEPKNYRAYAASFRGFPELVEAIAFNTSEVGQRYVVNYIPQEPRWWPGVPIDKKIRLHARDPWTGTTWVAAHYSPLLRHVILPLFDQDKWCREPGRDLLKQMRCMLACLLHVSREAFGVPHDEFLDSCVLVQMSPAYDRISKKPINNVTAVFVHSVRELLFDFTF